MADKKLTAVISAKDNTYPALKKFQSRVQKLSRSLEGISRLTARMGAAAGVGLAAAGASAVAAAKAYYTFGDGIATLAVQTGISTEKLQQLRYVAEMSDVSFEALTKATARFNTVIGSAFMGKGNQATALLKKMGFTAQNVARMTPDEQFARVAEAISRIPGQAQKAAVASAIFGKSYAELLPLLEQGREGIDRLTAKSAGLRVLSPEEIKQAEAMDDAVKNLTFGMEGLRNAVIAPAIPGITKAMEKLTAYMNGKGVRAVKKLSGGLSTVVEKFTIFVENDGLTRLIDRAEELYEKVKAVASAFGGVTNILTVMVGLWAIQKVASWTGAVLGAARAMGVFRLASMLAGAAVRFWKGTPALISAVAAALRGAALAGALFTATIGWVPLLIAGVVAAVVAAGYLIWKHWDRITVFMKEAWETCSAWIGEKWDALTNVITGNAIVKGLVAMFDGAMAEIKNLWNSLTAFITDSEAYRLMQEVKGWFAGEEGSPAAAAPGSAPGRQGLPGISPGRAIPGDAAARLGAVQRPLAELKITIDGAPAGTRVEETKMQGFDASTRVGYLAGGMGS